VRILSFIGTLTKQFCSRELLLVKGIASQGLGNWKKIADHVGTRTKEEVEEHYNSVYVDSPDWPLPVSGDRFYFFGSPFLNICSEAPGPPIRH